MPDNEKVMTKIEALLRKAESTNFGPESEALIAKAHELMARYSIEEAMLHKAEGVKDDVTVLQIKVTKTAKLPRERHVLLNEVAMANRCRAIITDDFMTIVGFKTDTQFVKVMYESLVLQMFESLLAEDYRTEVQRRSFGQGFCAAIHRRLDQVKRDVESEVAPAGSSTAIVLRDRGLAVREKVSEMFPTSGRSRAGGGRVDGGAYGAGQRAGNNADVGHKGIGGNRKELR